MAFPNIFTTNSSPENENCLENSLFSERPFSGAIADASSDDRSIEYCENMENENPFCEDSTRFSFGKCTQRPKKSVNWSQRAFSLLKTNSLIRSAPLAIGTSFWDVSNNGEEITLPTLGCGKSDAIKRISADTLVCLINKAFKREHIIIDARFKYEYEGGHIASAINLSSEDEILKRIKRNTVLVFYCEYSSVRGPSLAKRLRSKDRMKNTYPSLDFPEIYVLEGGYKNFFEKYSQFCTPVNYVQMHDKRFKKECINFHKKIKIKKN